MFEKSELRIFEPKKEHRLNYNMRIFIIFITLDIVRVTKCRKNYERSSDYDVKCLELNWLQIQSRVCLFEHGSEPVGAIKISFQEIRSWIV